jgi:hypothetical protein
VIKRLRQGLRALFAWAQPVDYDLAASVLKPSLLTLFRRMRRSEQLHSLNVLRLLRTQGRTEPSLMIAALLHDVGKTKASFHLWDRTLVVLVRAVAPSLVAHWGQAEPRGWNRPFAISVRHPEWSAEMVTAAGADPLTIELITRHQQYLDHPPTNDTEHLLAALQAADDAN